MATVNDMIASAQRSLRTADDLSDVNSPDRGSIEWLNSAVARLAQAVERQEQRTQHVAQALRSLADAIGYPVNSTRIMRERLRELAAVLEDSHAEA